MTPPELASAFMLAFARIGCVVMLLPGFGERSIPMRFRVGLAAILAATAMPHVSPAAARASGNALALALLFLSEITVGLLMGLAVRAMSSALASAGALIAQQTGLAYATTIDPGRGANEPILTTLLTLSGVAMIFATDLHLAAIEALMRSYVVFPPAGSPLAGDAAAHLLGAVGEGFSLAVRLAAPFLAGGLLMNLGFGVLGKAMPQLQLFQLSLALSIIVSIILLAVAIGPMLRRWQSAMSAAIASLGGG